MAAATLSFLAFHFSLEIASVPFLNFFCSVLLLELDFSLFSVMWRVSERELEGAWLPQGLCEEQRITVGG